MAVVAGAGGALGHATAAALAAGGAVGLLLGGALTEYLSWRWTLYVNLVFAGVALGVGFAAWQGRAANPLLPPRVVLDRYRGGAYLSMLIGTAGLFGTFLFLTYYLQQMLGYSPLVTGVAFLPISGGLVVASNLSTIVLMPRAGPKPLIAFGMLAGRRSSATTCCASPRLSVS